MSDAAFLGRLSEAVQAQHEATMHLQELASELVDHCSRMRAFTDRLHVMTRQDALIEPYQQPIPSGTLDITHMPTMLRGGPLKGER